MSSQRDGTEFRFSSLQQEGGWVSFCVPPPRNGPLSVLQKAIRLLALKHNWPSRTRGCARTSAVSLRSPALYTTVFSEQPITGCTLKFYASGLDPPHNSLQSEKIKTEGESARSLWDTDAYGDGWTSTVLFLVRSSKEKKKKKNSPPEEPVWAEQLAGEVCWPELPNPTSPPPPSPTTASAWKTSRNTFSGWLPAESKGDAPLRSSKTNRLWKKRANRSRGATQRRCFILVLV